MRKIRRVMLLIVVFMIAVSVKENTAFAKYVIQVVPDKDAWTAINVSDAYDACQDLNTDASSLGHTENLKAHLITNADYYAVSLLTYSAYGDRDAYKNNNLYNGSTTGNKTGLMRFGTKYIFTSSIIEGTTSNTNIKSLCDNINTAYVETVKNGTDREQNILGRGLLLNEKVGAGYGNQYVGSSTYNSYCIPTRNCLFGLVLTQQNNDGNPTGIAKGEAFPNATFRPVIWNK